MELIIKPTGNCNFKCSFCSSNKTPIMSKYLYKVPEKIKDVIRITKPISIIVTGGDPLLVDPEYFYDLYNTCKTNISITTNLKDFYLNPNKWIKLFNEPWLGIVTSFQYGSGRKWDDNTIYNEKMFITVYNLFKKYVDKKLPFIATINEENETSIIPLCKLAKRLSTIVKINNVLEQGLQESTYPRYKLFQAYIEIFENGYEEYESHCRDLNFQGCGFNTNFLCESCIRSVYIDKSGELHYTKCDDDGWDLPIINYKNDNFELIPRYPSKEEHVNENCWKCELFAICNGCKSQRLRYPKEHCEEMSKIKNKLIQYGFAEKGLI